MRPARAQLATSFFPLPPPPERPDGRTGQLPLSVTFLGIALAGGGYESARAERLDGPGRALFGSVVFAGAEAV